MKPIVGWTATFKSDGADSVWSVIHPRVQKKPLSNHFRVFRFALDQKWVVKSRNVYVNDVSHIPLSPALLHHYLINNMINNRQLHHYIINYIIT